MTSNGLEQRAKTGKCRICQRVRKTDEYLNVVGEVRHGYATGNIWECSDREACVSAAKFKIENSKNELLKQNIKTGLKIYAGEDLNPSQF